jgi:hypothetical protein
MKASLYAICAIVMLISGIGCTTGGGGGQGAVAGAVVTVQYVNPASFTDFSVQGRNLQSSTSVFTQQVTQALTPAMNSRFPGDRLTLRFTNIDLAGRTSTGPRSVRVVRNRTPARLSFNFVLQDQSGRAVASGSQRLVDTSRVGSSSRSGSLSSETQMLQGWLRSLSVTR